MSDDITLVVSSPDLIAVTVYEGYGPAGLPGAPGVPAGGTTGQVLTKISDVDSDAGWVTPATNSAGGIPATSVTTQAFGDDGTVGVDTDYAREDHKHAMPANPVTAHESTYTHANIVTAYNHSQSAHAPAAAEQNVNADWNASSGDAQILNKPAIPSIAGLLDHTAHDALDHAGLSGIPAAYTHPTGDGYLHVPANSTTNGGKRLTAGQVAGATQWEDDATTTVVGTDYGTQRLRNIKFMTTVPVAGDFDGNGSIIEVYTP